MLLEIKNLSIDFSGEGATVSAVKNIDLQLAAGTTLGLVGESGSGKSVTALSVMRLLPPAARARGQILYNPPGQTAPVDLLALAERDLPRYRGAEIAMIYQEPMTALNPVTRCGLQVAETLRLHQNSSAAEAREQTLTLFEQVRLTDPGRMFRAYPHELSGGQKQRILIAMALAANPKILIADEPTTALDVSVQKSILDLLLELRASRNLSMLFISHDLGVISEIADRVCVMQQGEIVETGDVDQVLRQPAHPYAKGLVACRTSLTRKWRRLPTIRDFQNDPHFRSEEVPEADTRARRETLYGQTPLLRVEQLRVRYPAAKNWLGMPSRWHFAVDDVNFEIFPGEIFGVAGESGCGKTTLGRVICLLANTESGRVFFESNNLSAVAEREKKFFRRHIQMAFQDPYASLNPRMTVGESLSEPLLLHRLCPDARTRRARVAELLEAVGLEPDHAGRYPRAFSGGQRQRICLARALAVEPKLLICDEVVSALDVSVQATVLNLLLDLREKFGLTYLFISHDLSVMHQMCDRVLIMQEGKAVEIGYPEELFQAPKNAYVRELVAAVPGK